jgi:aldehyde:ferredoxin oxidoreductase
MKLGRVLNVDLERRRAAFEPLAPEERRRLGGAALGVTILERLWRRGAGPLDPANPWILSIGPLAGSAQAPRPQAAITHLSPLTGGLNDSVVSHPLAEFLAATGTAALVLTGASDTPLWLRLSEDGVAFEDARHLWGRDLPEAAAALRAASGSEALVIGPAAEAGVLYACVGSEGHSAGRGGPGTALAARRVKGIAAGRGRAEPAGTAFSGQPAGAPAERAPRGGHALERLRTLNERRGLPTRNFRERSFAGTQALAAGLEAVSGSQRLPYEGLFAFGPLLGVSDAGAVLRCIACCDRLGLDVISAGGTLAWAIESAESGALDAPLPRFGDSRELEDLLQAAARREGSGEILALGSRRAAERLGRGSSSLAMHVRGLEIPGYDPRAFPSLALGYSVGSRGACHVRSGAYQIDFDAPLPDPPDPGELARRAAEFEDRSTLLDSLIFNRSWRAELGDPFEGAARLLHQAGEEDLADAAGLRRTMCEVADARRRINLACGWDPQGDVLPERLLREDGGGATPLNAARLKTWVAAYYARRGWSSAGVPPRPASP